MIDRVAIRRRYEAVAPHLDERGLRLFAASEARAAGRGGIAAVSLATGIAHSTIGRGLHDLDSDAQAWPSGRVRRSGGGRKAAVVEQPGLVEALSEMITAFDTHVGTPDDVIASLRADSTLERVTDLVFQAHSIDPPHPFILRSIELIAEKVAPALGWTKTTAVDAG